MVGLKLVALVVRLSHFLRASERCLYDLYVSVLTSKFQIFGSILLPETVDDDGSVAGLVPK